MMKTLLLGFTLCVFMLHSIHAQNRPTPEERAKAQTEQMTKDLNLDAAQQEKVAKLNADFATKIKEARNEHKGNREAVRNAMKQLNQERQNELKLILTADQYKKHLELEKQRREQRRNNRSVGNTPRR